MSKERALTLLSMDHAALETLVREFQLGHGLKVDGWPGDATRDAIRVARGVPELATPIPRTRAGVHRTYGSFEWTPSRGRHIDIDDDWEDKNIRRFKLHTGQRRRLHRLVGEEFVALFRKACDRSGYTPKSVQTFVPRRIKDHPDSKLSYHSWGIAVDFDPRLNAMGAKNLEEPGQPCPLVAHPEFLQVFRDAGWGIGHDWKMKDTMHIQRKS
jgi:hypothetical protein